MNSSSYVHRAPVLSPCQRPASSRPSTTNLGRGSQFWRGTVAVRLLEVGNADTDAKTEDGSRPQREAAAAGRVRNRPCFQYQAAWRTTKDLTGRTFGGRACIAQKVDFNHFLPLVRWQIISTAGGPRAVWARSGRDKATLAVQPSPRSGRVTARPRLVSAPPAANSSCRSRICV